MSRKLLVGIGVAVIVALFIRGQSSSGGSSRWGSSQTNYKETGQAVPQQQAAASNRATNSGNQQIARYNKLLVGTWIRERGSFTWGFNSDGTGFSSNGRFLWIIIPNSNGDESVQQLGPVLRIGQAPEYLTDEKNRESYFILQLTQDMLIISNGVGSIRYDRAQ